MKMNRLNNQNYERLRNNSNNILKNIIFDFNATTENLKKLLEHAMCSDDAAFINLLSKHIFLCFIKRENSLKSVEDWETTVNNYIIEQLHLSLHILVYSILSTSYILSYIPAIPVNRSCI